MEQKIDLSMRLATEITKDGLERLFFQLVVHGHDYTSHRYGRLTRKDRSPPLPFRLSQARLRYLQYGMAAGLFPT